MFVWGKADDGQLGLGGIEDTFIPVARWNKHVGHRAVRQMACGRSHTLILLEDEKVLSCGSNEQGQLGQDESSTRPAVVHLPHGVSVQHVSCGHSHCIALDNRGQLFSWGDNTHGQLGVGRKESSKPVHVESLAQFTVVQATCGSHHTMTLLQDGRLFSWGQNSRSQLGHSSDSPSISTPRVIKALEGVPVTQIATGGRHNFVLSVSGTVYGWGKNDFGQLGIGHQNDTSVPTELITLHNHEAKHIACGDDHTAILTADGSVFTFGAGGCGQLGHSSTDSAATPTKVSALVGSTVSQIACGRCHTLALIESTGKIYSFGLGANGQLGNSTTTNQKTPVPVHGGWLPSASLQEEGDLIDFGTPVDLVPLAEHGFVVKRVFAGGDQSFVSVIVNRMGVKGLGHSRVYDCRLSVSSQLPFFLSFERVKQLLDVALITKTTANVVRTLEMVFSRPAILNGSFLRSDAVVSESCSCVDIDSARQTFGLMQARLKGTDFESRILHAISSLLPSLPSSFISPECGRVFYLLPAFIMTQTPNWELLVSFLAVFLKLDVKSRNVIGNWLFSESREYLHLWLTTVKGTVSKVLLKSKDWISAGSENKNPIGVDVPSQQFSPLEEGMLKLGLQFLKQIHNWNMCHGEVIPHQDFHLKEVTEVVDLLIDFFNWVQTKSGVIVFCQFPFVLDVQAKADLMKYESKLNMQLAVAHAQQQNFASLVTQRTIEDFSPHAFELHVNRHNLVNSTLQQLVSTDERNYKKPLKVVFAEEPGEDEGGVQKEFFMLLLQEILNPDFGMFTEDEESHFVWFREQALFYESLDYFVLVGIVCGLAIYNSVIIDLPFPTALYKKLLERSTDLSDLTELHPSVGTNLKSMLEYDEDDFEENFGLNFSIFRSSFGEVQTIDLIPDGSSIPVTKDTRQQYVDAYVNYVMTEAVKEPFEAFAKGFLRVCNGNVLGLIHPKELMVLVVGNQVVDWTELEKYMQYRNYTPKDSTIRLFWKVFYELPTEAKRKFLVFYTGSNRIPVTGIKNMKMLIQRTDGGPRCERLPVAHTCFNVLDLPPYRTYEQMKQKLLQAINFTAGFGIV